MFNLILGVIIGTVISIIFFTILAVINDKYIIDIIKALIYFIITMFVLLILLGVYRSISWIM